MLALKYAQDLVRYDSVSRSSNRAVTDFAERYSRRGRCPADDILDTIGAGKGRTS